jgi:hypothetical protein
MFLLDLAEMSERPEDMMMLVGEYFKCIIEKTRIINSNIINNSEGNRELKNFYINYDILNYLATACKMMVD